MAERGKPAGKPTCPICGKTTADRFRPFCSARCADVDLGRWLTGSYAIPGHADAAEDDESEARPAAARARPQTRGDDHADD